MEKKIIYQSKGMNKKPRIRLCIMPYLLLALGIFELGMIFYELVDEKYLIPVFIIAVVCISFIMYISAMCKTEVDLYGEYMEFTDCSMMTFVKMTCGLIPSKNMKKIQIRYDDIIDVKSDIRLSRIDVSTKNEKQYHIFCQHPEELKEKLEIQL